MKHSTRTIKKSKSSYLQMLTCYDYQTAQLLNETDVDLILVGDSLGNVILGLETTVQVTIEHMIIFGEAVRRGAPDKFLIIDMPFGSTKNISQGLIAATKLFQTTKAESLKIEGAYPTELKLIKRLTEIGIPVMGHIGLVPQSVHQLGGYYTHGKNDHQKNKLMQEALALQEAGCFSIVLECVEENLSSEITQKLSIPTIGIGSGIKTDGQVLVINDLLQLGPTPPPKFCQPIANLYKYKKQLINSYLQDKKQK